MSKRILKVLSENWDEEPFAISRGSSDNFSVVVVKLEQNGFQGCAECTPTERNNESIQQTISLIENYRKLIERGISRFEIQSLMPKGAARNAVDCALWDLESKISGKRIWELKEVLKDFLKSKTFEPKIITTFYSIGLDTPEKMGVLAKRNSKRPCLKIKLTGNGDLERIYSIRDNAPDARLIVDANEGWDFNHYSLFVPEFLKLGIELIEQPFPAEKDKILKDLEHPIPICADESCHDRADLPYLEGLYEFINIKLDKTGGLSEAIKLQNEAESRGFKTMVGCMSSTSLGIAPAFLIAQRAEIIDLDAPLYLYNDRKFPIKYDLSKIYPPTKELWG